MSWIDEVLEATTEAETPRGYIYWSSIATISAIIGPNVWINRQGVYLLSPNLFVMLIGESGLGKGLPIYIAKKLVKMVGTTRVISGRNTIQSILRDLGSSETDEKTGVPKWKDARGFLPSGEFSTLLQEDKAALPILTELYDTHYSDDWENRTKGSGKDKLEKVNLTLLGGSTPEHFKNVVPEADVKGGFVGRILTVYEEERAKINPLAETEVDFKLPFDKLVEHLKTIALLRGPFAHTPKAKKLWIDWYTDIRTRKVHDPTGAVNRLPDNVLKVAMCLSLSKQADKLIIHEGDLSESIDRCMHLTIDSRRLTGGQGGGTLGQSTHLVIQVLFRAENNMMPKSQILRQYYGHFDVYELDRIISTLETAGMIECSLMGADIIIKMKEEAVRSIKSFMER